MLNPDLKLNPKIFEPDIEKNSTRAGFGEGLVIAGDKDKNIVALCADLMESTRMDAFAQKYPERYFEVGVAEQNLISIGAGLGVSGKIPFVASFAVFSPGRTWEQIRTTVAYNDSNVKIVGSHSGIMVGQDGVTHQAVEDIATMRAIANMKIIVPCDSIEAKKATLAAAKLWGPFYLRLGRDKTSIMTTEHTHFVPGKAQIFWQSRSPRVAIIGCGPLLYNALLAAHELEKEKIGTIVVNCHTIKPLDEETILGVAKKCGAIVTVEDHNVKGGLGGAVAELLAHKRPTHMEFIGLQDIFAESGVPKDLIEKYGMGVGSIKKAAHRAANRV